MNNELENTPGKSSLQEIADALGSDIQRLFVFFSLYENALEEGALASKTKQLIALAMAVGTQNKEAVNYHVNEALQRGATRDEIREAVTVAVLVAGARSMLSGAEALAAVARFEAQQMVSTAVS